MIMLNYQNLLRIAHHVFLAIPAVCFFSSNQRPQSQETFFPNTNQKQTAGLGNLNHRSTLVHASLRITIITHLSSTFYPPSVKHNLFWYQIYICLQTLHSTNSACAWTSGSRLRATALPGLQPGTLIWHRRGRWSRMVYTWHTSIVVDMLAYK